LLKLLPGQQILLTPHLPRKPVIIPPTSMLQRIGRYEILERIATGGQGTVYRARDTVLDRIVAVKIINQSIADDPAYLEALQREARLAARPKAVGKIS